jgi:hypothetical protein
VSSVCETLTTSGSSYEVNMAVVPERSYFSTEHLYPTASHIPISPSLQTCVPEDPAVIDELHCDQPFVLQREEIIELNSTSSDMDTIRDNRKQVEVDTPRKKDLKYRLRLKIRQCRRMRAKLYGPKVNATDSMQSALRKLRPCLSDAAFSLLSAQVRLCNKSVRYWSDNERLVAMSIYYQSPKAYRFLSKIMKLPSKTSICRWVQNVRVQPGLNSYMIKLLEAKVKNLSVKDKQCILLMDEVALKKGLRYCKMRDIVVGYVDDGVERSTVMANSALVFMVRGLFKR